MKLLSPRGFGVTCASLAVAAGLAVAGCADSIDGTPTANQAEATSYKAEAASSSAAATSSRRAAAEAKAIADNCDPFRDTTGPAVSRYNEFVDAHDANAGDYAAKRDTAVNTIEDAAKTVETRVATAGDTLPPDLAQKFNDYVTAARALAAEARKMSYTSPVGPLNDASKKVNDALNAVRNACPAR
ncbi:hypothetical protein [Nocardia sp. NPDC050406]|uniref:hypothetical protein n=1 Tax=Nocardia sp. NPDC050406 TaxID=3364318 RepID=UPI00378FA98E